VGEKERDTHIKSKRERDDACEGGGRNRCIRKGEKEREENAGESVNLYVHVCVYLIV
jgi:hypothetical protein